ncbi:MAG: hypothetical protein NC938_07530 [Candidatus Omnitrophica bacterium]|nr:hypothetical protein [Candidatus Omnitrophota bacterium]MCM8791517.1 hypothetical protein [Candidatus Omnitrophota bacterium]
MENKAEKMIRTAMTICLIGILSAASSFAQVNLEATGYDWIEYTPQQKQDLVKTLYHILKIDGDIANGVTALDGLYYIYYQEVKKHPDPKAIDVVFSATVMEILVDIVTFKGKPSKEIMKKYGLTDAQ